MKVTIITLFPEMFWEALGMSMMKRAQEKGIVSIHFCNIRDFGIGKHRSVDDTPYGGGVGMVLRVDVLYQALSSVTDPTIKNDSQSIILLDPRGETFTQKHAQKFSRLAHLILICGHYEGYDERIRNFIDGEISLGDFVLTGGEIPAMAVVDATIRLIPGFLRDTAVQSESFSGDEGILEAPTYTKPQRFKNFSVPEVLVSGNHARIQAWRKEQSFLTTRKNRPDLLPKNSERKEV